MENNAKHEAQTWSAVIEPNGKFLNLNLKEIWNSRDLLHLFIKRNIITVYKQTILGWLWFVINPILSTVLYMFVFGGIAGLSTDGLPQSVFYMAGVLLWSYFSACFNATSNFLSGNTYLFEKVYFPRLILPISALFSSLVTFAVQGGLLLITWLYFRLGGVQIHATWELLALPLYVLLLAGTGFSWGLICNSLTIKYRDLNSFIRVGMNLLMYVTPVVYPLSLVESRSYGWVLRANPLTGIFECFRHSITGLGAMDWGGLLYCFACMCATLFLGLWMFSRSERNFIDTV
ncbi:MAG: ABC transporter permease [Bacteroidales bacterium]|nr:ABC transporter permease [Bacteroidales bacterium]